MMYRIFLSLWFKISISFATSPVTLLAVITRSPIVPFLSFPHFTALICFLYSWNLFVFLLLSIRIFFFKSSWVSTPCQSLDSLVAFVLLTYFNKEKLDSLDHSDCQGTMDKRYDYGVVLPYFLTQRRYNKTKNWHHGTCWVKWDVT